MICKKIVVNSEDWLSLKKQCLGADILLASSSAWEN